MRGYLDADFEVKMEGEYHFLDIPNPQGLTVHSYLGFYSVSDDKKPYTAVRPKSLEGIPDNLSQELKEQLNKAMNTNKYERRVVSSKFSESSEYAITNSFTYYTLEELKDINLEDKLPMKESSDAGLRFAESWIEQEGEKLEGSREQISNLTDNIRKAVKNGGSTEIEIIRYKLKTTSGGLVDKWITLEAWKSKDESEKKKESKWTGGSTIVSDNYWKSEDEVETEKATLHVKRYNKGKYLHHKEFLDKLDELKNCLDENHPRKHKIEFENNILGKFKRPKDEFVNCAEVSEEDIRICMWQFSLDV